MWGKILTGSFQKRRFCARRSPVPALEILESRNLLSAVAVELSANLDNTIYDIHTADTSNGLGEFIVTGGASGVSAARRGLVSFDVGSAGIPEGSTILDVVLTLNLAQTTGGPASVAVHRMTQGWGEGVSNASGNEFDGATAGAMDATWLFSRYDGLVWTEPGGDFAGSSGSVSVANTGAYEWTGSGLVDDVQSWLDEPFSNFGWMVLSNEAAGNVKAFISRNSSNVALRPTLEITYEEPVLPGIVEGRKWHDKNANGLRESTTIQSLSLEFRNGKSLYNVFGGKEYWYFSQTQNSWYFLTSSGALTQWSREPRSLTGRVIERLDSRVWFNPESLLITSIRSEEPWMNGVVFDLLNANGDVVATTVSQDMDRNGDRIIQDETERGWYRFENVMPGKYTVREVVPEGWVQSASSTSPGAAEAFRLDTELGLSPSSVLHTNFGGRGEKWIRGSAAWYYITPAGDLFRWNGRAVTARRPLTGTLVASPGISYFRDVSLLHSARNPELTVNPGDVISRVDFGNYQPVIITGQNYFYQIPAWLRNSPQFTASPVGPGNWTNGVDGPLTLILWQALVINTAAQSVTTASYGGLGPTGGSAGSWLALRGDNSVSYTVTSTVRAGSISMNLRTLDQGQFRILDFLFSNLSYVR